MRGYPGRYYGHWGTNTTNALMHTNGPITQDYVRMMWAINAINAISAIIT